MSMTREEFAPGMSKLLGIFNPYRWSDDQDDQYFECFKWWSVDQWEKGVSEIIRSNKKMPVPAELFALNIESEPITDFERESCEKCVDGHIWVDMKPKKGQIYTQMFGCDCPAGRWAQTKLLNTARKKNPSLQQEQMSYTHYARMHSLDIPDAPLPPHPQVQVATTVAEEPNF